jgi:hypothetical protein
MTRDQIALALQQQQQQRGGPGRSLGSPFAPPPVPQPQQPFVAGTPNAPVAAPIPQYGFETGYRAAAGAPGENKTQDRLKQLAQMLFGAPGTTGGAAP